MFILSAFIYFVVIMNVIIFIVPAIFIFFDSQSELVDIIVKERKKPN